MVENKVRFVVSRVADEMLKWQMRTRQKTERVNQRDANNKNKETSDRNTQIYIEREKEINLPRRSLRSLDEQLNILDNVKSQNIYNKNKLYYVI